MDRAVLVPMLVVGVSGIIGTNPPFLPGVDRIHLALLFVLTGLQESNWWVGKFKKSRGQPQRDLADMQLPDGVFPLYAINGMIGKY